MPEPIFSLNVELPESEYQALMVELTKRLDDHLTDFDGELREIIRLGLEAKREQRPSIEDLLKRISLG